MKDQDNTLNQCKDTGLAIILILLIATWITKNFHIVLPAILILILTMTIPKIFKPLAYLWFGLSHIMGAVVSKVFLTIVFFVIATPIGQLRKFFGKDPMDLKEWKNSKESVFKERNHTFTSKDMEKPF